MGVVGKGKSLCLGALQSFGVRGLESRALWMASLAQCFRVGGDFLRGVFRQTGECWTPSLSTHTVPTARRPALWM